jgi:two-component system response regulator YesN
MKYKTKFRFRVLPTLIYLEVDGTLIAIVVSPLGGSIVKLLIVDDENFTREGVASSLHGEFGITDIAQADCGISALEVIDSFKPDIIITDIRMPRMDGIELAYKVRDIMPDCKIIFMSGYSDKAYFKSAISLKALNYIEKPIDLEELRDALRQAVNLKMDETSHIQHNEQLKRSLLESIPLIKAEIATELTKIPVDLEHIRNRAINANMTLPLNGYFQSLIIKFASSEVPSGDYPNTRNRIVQAAEQLFGENGYRSLCVLKNESQLLVHLYTEDTPILEHILTAIGKKLAEEAHELIRLSITAGKQVRQLEHLVYSYEQSMSLLPLTFYKDHGSVTFFCENETSSDCMNPDIVNTFIKSVGQDNWLEASQIITDLANYYKLHDSTPIESTKDLFLKLLSPLFDQDETFRLDEPSDTPLWEKISRFQSLDEIVTFAHHVLDNHLAWISQQKGTTRIVRETIRFIKISYSNEKLSLQSLCDHTHLTPNYLCSVFKAHTGQTINGYITKYRIDKAQGLLSDPKLTVLQIAQLVGYSNSNYFAKVFRKVIGMNPTKYRDKMLL